MSPSLSVVGDREASKPETVAQRVRRLQDEARALAKDHVAEFTRAMADLGQLASEIAAGGEAYHPGVRDIARRLSEDLENRVQTLEAISTRKP